MHLFVNLILLASQEFNLSLPYKCKVVTLLGRSTIQQKGLCSMWLLQKSAHLN